MRIMRILGQDDGQVLAISALSLVVVMGLVGMAVDVGTFFHDKRDQQNIVDAAAMSAAVAYKDNASVSMAQAAGQTAATKNGSTDSSYLTVNIPPQSGPFAGESGFVEAVLTEPRPTFFMRLFGFNSVNVTARAVASVNGPPADPCVTVLDKTMPGAMTLQGSFTVDASHCGVEVASSDPDALQFTGAGGSLVAKWVAVYGGDGGQTGDSTPPPMTYTHVPVNDPYGGITGPTPSGACSGGTDSWVLGGQSVSTTGSTDSKTKTLTGTYTGPGAGNAICFTKAVTLSNVVLGQGIYVFENGVTLQGSVTGIGVTLDIYSGSLTIPKGGVSFGSATATTAAQAQTDGLVAPTSGPTNGIAIMEPPSNHGEIQLQKGNATGNITGTIYAPSAELYLQDSGGDKSGGISFWGRIIVDSLYDKTATMTVHAYSDAFPSTDPLRIVSLVE